MPRSAPESRTRNGFVLDSKAECRRYDELQALRRAGEVIWFLRQVPFDLLGVEYAADFEILWADGRLTFEEVKSKNFAKRPDYTRTVRSLRQVQTEYGIEVELVER